MTEHYTRNTESALRYCPTCGRITVHAVSDGRLRHCTEHKHGGESKKQRTAREKREAARQQALRQPDLFQ